MSRGDVVGGGELEAASKAKKGARYVLKLYIAGPSRSSVHALTNAKSILDRHLAGRFDLEILDIRADPSIASRDDVLVAPMLVKQLPLPLRKIVGDLADEERVLLALGVKGRRA